MASEDSVEHMLERALSLLTVRVHRLGKLHDLHQPFRGAVSAGLTEIQDHHEAREIAQRARRTACSAAGTGLPVPVTEDANGSRRPARPRSRAYACCATQELLDGHLEQRPATAMSRDAERRLDEEAERNGAMRLDGDMNAALSFDDTG